VLEFSYIVGSFNAMTWSWGEKRIKEEINERMVVCANCHRKNHLSKTKYSEVV
jgi:hypothetical protein